MRSLPVTSPVSLILDRDRSFGGKIQYKSHCESVSFKSISGQAVSINGQLLGANGAPLPGKKVICEASDRVGNRSDFMILGISTTNEKGYFKFTASGGSTTTFIQVRFPGDDEYDESVSDLIMVL